MFGLDHVADAMNDPSGEHGTEKIWRDDVLFRLEVAAEGVYLNDTPSGKQPGRFTTF